MNEYPIYRIVEQGEPADPEWEFYLLLRNGGDEPVPKIEKEALYELEEKYGQDVSISSLYFIPVMVLFKKREMAMEFKLRYI